MAHMTTYRIKTFAHASGVRTVWVLPREPHRPGSEVCMGRDSRAERRAQAWCRVATGQPSLFSDEDLAVLRDSDLHRLVLRVSDGAADETISPDRLRELLTSRKRIVGEKNRRRTRRAELKELP